VTRPAVITNPGSTLLSGRHSVVLKKKKKKERNLRFIATVAVAPGHDISNVDTTLTIPPREDKGSSVFSRPPPSLCALIFYLRLYLAKRYMDYSERAVASAYTRESAARISAESSRIYVSIMIDKRPRRVPREWYDARARA